MKLQQLWSRRPHPDHDRQLLSQINMIARSLVNVSDADLVNQCHRLKILSQHPGDGLDGLIVRSFALAFESVRRVLGLTCYPEQLLAGLAMIRGEIVEMQTGEGKTIAAVFPACWFALTGCGVHVMTVNSYLAERDFQDLSPVYERLGLSVGLNQTGLAPEAKRDAYAADITYGPGYEFGFDYLRDQMALQSQQPSRLGNQFASTLCGSKTVEPPRTVQRSHAAAIIDEADSVMIDEATVPLVLSSRGGQPADNPDVYHAAREVALTLKADRDFVVNDRISDLLITDLGILRLSTDISHIPNERLDHPWLQYVDQALRAEYFYHRDIHYVVFDNRVQIVDPHTSRIFADRNWRNGLHQAVEAKEGKTITRESQPLARILRQKYFQKYDLLCGMSGTVQGCHQEFYEVYGTDYSVVPPHRLCQRNELPPRLFVDQKSRELALIESILELHSTQRPVLVGTSNIESSQRLSRKLHERQIEHHLLNGLQDAAEATVIASAGQRGSITIATNLAGRGTDIKLDPDTVRAGGLHVIASEFQLSARIDRQLIGRAARKGEPGSSQIFAAIDDPFFLQTRSYGIRSWKRRADVNGEIYVTKQILNRIVKLQHEAERTNRNQRKHLVQHDDWLCTATCGT
ncbi:preprotein translocase subunit SecA [Gimesia sp.]|uniref:preprotein translocase subunit SecA n=1 Tax=Gimesia sp. TaxID=2024833 RepID=UPI003A8F697A